MTEHHSLGSCDPEAQVISEKTSARALEFHKIGWSLLDLGGHGNCMYYVAAYLLRLAGFDDVTSELLRAAVAVQMSSSLWRPRIVPAVYQPQFPSADAYIAAMGQLGTYGDQLVLEIIAHMYHIRFKVYVTSRQSFFVGDNDDPHRPELVVHYDPGAEHYQALVQRHVSESRQFFELTQAAKRKSRKE